MFQREQHIMVARPVIARELLIQARKKSLYRGRLAVAILAFLFMLWLTVSTALPVSPAIQGQGLFAALSRIAFIYCLVMGAFVSADCLSVEKREGTLRLLFLTDLKTHDIVLGKFVSASLQILYGLIGIAPVLAVTSLFGGVTWSQILETSMVLGNTLFLSLAAGMLASTLFESERKAIVAALFFVMMAAAGPYALGYWAANNLGSGTVFSVDESHLVHSPVYAFAISQTAKPRMVPQSVFYSSLAVTHLIAWCWLILSWALIPRFSREPIRRPGSQASLLARITRVFAGRTGVSPQFRARLLDRNPVAWLFLRSHRKQGDVWILILSFSIMGWWIHRQYNLAFFEAAIALNFIAFVMLKVWFTTELCQLWVADKHNGSLELLLSTPIQTRTIVQGQNGALLYQFGWPVAASVLLVFISWAALARAPIDPDTRDIGRTWIWISIPVLILDLLAIRWVGLWFALTCRGLSQAIISTFRRIFFWRWLLFLGFVLVFNAFGGRHAQNAWSWLKFFLLIALALDISFMLLMRRNFLQFFRGIAANPSGWRDIITNPAHADEAAEIRTIDSEKNWGLRWASRLNVRVSVWKFALALMLVLFAARYWLKYRVDSRLKTLPALRQEQAALPSGAGLSLANRITSLLPDVNLTHQRSGLDLVSTDFASSNPRALAKIYGFPSLRSARYWFDLSSQSWGKELRAFQLVGDLLEADAYLWSSQQNYLNALHCLRLLFDLSTVEVEPRGFFADLRRQTLLKAVTLIQQLIRQGLSKEHLQRIAEDLELSQPEDPVLPTIVDHWRGQLIESYRAGPYTFLASNQPRPPGVSVAALTLQTAIADAIGAPQRDFLRNLDALEMLMKIAETPFPSRVTLGESLGADSRTFQQLVAQDATFSARVRLTLIAVALERYRKDHAGELPAKLPQLVPGCLEGLPFDPFTGEAILYENASSSAQNGIGGAEIPRRGYRLSVSPSKTAESLSAKAPTNPFVLTID